MPQEGTIWGRLGAVYRRLTDPSSSAALSSTQPDTDGGALPASVGRYRVTGKLGQGGMGVVYAGRDDRLERNVALKTIAPVGEDSTSRRRFWREARAAASINHPNICQIYEIGEDHESLFIAMELLEGETLAKRLQRGPLPAPETLALAREILAALAALHARAIIHRDLKPSNVFLTPHGVKLLDFGVARATSEAGSDTATALTRAGAMVGTPRYMAPEQVRGEVVDARADLFALGAVLFEMLSGQPAFRGDTAVDVLHATLHEQPPALAGSQAIVGIDRVVRRALAKRPDDRPASADVMAAELTAIDGLDASTPVLAQPLTRLMVLPFRILRSDPESDFLAYSLADAIAMSLSRLDSLVVRSTAAAARFTASVPDLKTIAAEAEVDRVVTGTLLRAGDQVRVAAQLVDAPAGTLLGSHTVQSSMGDLFGLQDDLARRLVASLSLPLTGTPTLFSDAPRHPRAYELYLRANELARTYAGLPQARDLYVQCLEIDPHFAPAWAYLGRCHRVIGKYVEPTPGSEAAAAAAFERALAIDPRLSLAHRLMALLEADTGGSLGALVRLLNEASRRGNDPELFAGLVHVCRYCGLFDHAQAAHREARRLDPTIPTSIAQTLLIAGETDRLLASGSSVSGGGDDGIRVIGLGLAGHRDEARRELEAMRSRPQIGTFQAWASHLSAWLDGDVDALLRGLPTLAGLTIVDDPEALFQEGWMLCDVGAHDAGLPYLDRAVTKGYFVSQTLARRQQFDALRDRADFRAILARAEEGRRQALAICRAAGAEQLIGV